MSKKTALKVGDKFNKLTLIELPLKGVQSKAVFLCECGTKKKINAWSVIRGHTGSCGCMGGSWTHRMTKTPTYRVWKNMKQRCLNPDNPGWSKYGGRGIRVCERWMKSFDNFLLDMGAQPKGMSIDRINTNGNYEPSNCRWATIKEQTRNTRHNVFITFNGVTLCQVEWAEKLGIKGSSLRYRLNNWPMDEAMTAKPNEIMHPDKRGPYRRSA